MIKIALIGCTGNIGKQVAEVVRRYPEQFCFSALACGKNTAALSALAKEFHPAHVMCEGDAFRVPTKRRSIFVGYLYHSHADNARNVFDKFEAGRGKRFVQIENEIGDFALTAVLHMRNVNSLRGDDGEDFG